jgi:hypothetical protein
MQGELPRGKALNQGISRVLLRRSSPISEENYHAALFCRITSRTGMEVGRAVVKLYRFVIARLRLSRRG